MKISNHYRIENGLGAFIYLDQDEVDELVAVVTAKAQERVFIRIQDITNHDWQDKAIESMEKVAAEKYPATELVKEIDRLIPQDTLVKESPETLRDFTHDQDCGCYNCASTNYKGADEWPEVHS